MTALIGIAVVLCSVIGGYAMENGNFSVLFQPAEFLIILGAATGSLILSSPGKILKAIIHDLGHIFADSKLNKEHYIQLLLLLNAIYAKIKKEGLIAIEADVETPEKSALFQKHTAIMSDHNVAEFICDTIRVMITANYPPHEMENLMDIDLEINNHERMIPSHSITKMGDALPGLGIVAAVLGVVLTMGMISEPPEVLGHHIGAALVGTFLGVLSCYGFIGPIATNLEHKANERAAYMNVIKTSLMAAYSTDFMIHFAIESGRRAIPGEDRPSFLEVEEALKKWKATKS